MEPPSSFKPIKKFLNLANALQEEEPCIAYCCRSYAVQLGIELRSKPQRPEELKFLTAIMDTLEKDKPSIDAAFPNNRIEYAKNFALKVFEDAKEDDQASEAADVKDGLTYLHASILIESLNQFEGAMTKELMEMEKYARWRAIEIARGAKGGWMPAKGRQAPSIRSSVNAPSPTRQGQENTTGSVSNNDYLDKGSFARKNELSGRKSDGVATHAADKFVSAANSSGKRPNNDNFNRSSSASSVNSMSSSKAAVSSTSPVHQVCSKSATKPVTSQEVDKIFEASKQARNAFSALEFDDTQTAVNCFREGLRILEADK